MTPDRVGRSRLTRDLLRELLRELLLARPASKGGARPATIIAEQTATSPDTAEWLRQQGAVAADVNLSPLDKVVIISAALGAKLKDLELLDYLGDDQLSQIAHTLKEIVTERDADVLHAGLRDRVLAYTHKVLGIYEPDDTAAGFIREADAEITKTLTLLRFREIDPHLAMTQLAFDLTGLAADLGVDRAALRQQLEGIDKRLWELISPYVDEPPAEAASAQEQTRA